ncbi:hypothetical protein [Colwellia sp. RSH04]|uniref:hypothetical protein n=1 Tax=Colwellia sp. RSH04 TaxID=2305464 RepID=UPI000E598A0F|nr:hypothetical protein [Colwellia sp. RSH04]RHW75855.1 hypothetical protein D1094_12125 [Colwellia sp. RSH04]
MLKKLVCYLLIIFPLFALAMPKISIKHQRTADDYAQIQVTNTINLPLICHVAIDGHKIRFQLKPYEASKWYKATDKRFNYDHFSVWCDYLSLHPELIKKK